MRLCQLSIGEPPSIVARDCVDVWNWIWLTFVISWSVSSTAAIRESKRSPWTGGEDLGERGNVGGAGVQVRAGGSHLL